MTFAELNAEFARLRHSLRTFVGEDALTEISVQPPASQDEASFLRLIAWSYVLVFEAGRVTIPYLINLPSGMDPPQTEIDDARDLIHDLRTWSFHNLGFTEQREILISKRTALWFIENARANPPNSADGWRSCFERLCSDVCVILAHCRSAVELALAESEDRRKIIVDLRLRLDRNWPAHKFDELTSDVVVRLGQTLDVPKFRQARLAKWRAFLETIPESDDPQTLVVRLIERDVLDHFETILPIDGQDVMIALDLSPGPKVGEALTYARLLYRSGVTDADKLLELLLQEHRAG